jgi:hypothetical protein
MIPNQPQQRQRLGTTTTSTPVRTVDPTTRNTTEVVTVTTVFTPTEMTQRQLLIQNQITQLQNQQAQYATQLTAANAELNGLQPTLSLVSAALTPKVSSASGASTANPVV